MTDPIADMIIRVKNAYLARKTEVAIPHSKVNESIARLLEEKQYIEKSEVEDTTPQKTIRCTLRYRGNEPALTDVKRYSKPGRRVYVSKKKIPRTVGGYGLTVVTTSAGVMSDEEARAKGLGGEVLCMVW